MQMLKPIQPLLKSSLNKPLVVGGVGLALAASVWDMASASGGLGILTWGTVAAGASTWWLTRRNRPLIDFGPSPTGAAVDAAAVEARLAEVLATLQHFEAAATPADSATGAKTLSPSVQAVIAQLYQQHQTLVEGMERQHLRCAVVGGQGVGKTQVTQCLQASLSAVGAPAVDLLDTAALLTPGTLSDPSAPDPSVTALDSSIFPARLEPIVSQLLPADMVLMVVDGDLTASEWTIVQDLAAQHYALMLVFNKSDRHLPQEQAEILEQLQRRVSAHIKSDRVVCASTVPAKIKVRVHGTDGEIEERLETTPPSIGALTETFHQWAAEDRQQRVWDTTVRQARQLNRKIVLQWNGVRRDRALPLIEKYQWLAAATTFANPLPTFDLVATGAITAQLCADLGELYDQPFSVDQATSAAGTIAELIVKLGLVELTTQAIAPLLKTHALTFAAGGLLQGVSAAYLTHVAGLSLIRYFEAQSLADSPETSAWNLERLGQMIQQTFQEQQRGAFLKGLVKRGVDVLVRSDAARTPASAATGA